tara:strand:- start:505 stop:1230 length:726 start_codon:yes stop_codon:yes gene_type:complete
MRLGLSNIASSSGNRPLSEFSIANVSGIQTWLKFNTGQSDDGDRIIWADSSGQGNPIDDASSGTNDRVEFTGGALHLKQVDGSTYPEANFNSEIVLTGAFTIFVVVDVDDDLNAESIFQGSASSGSNFFRFAHGNVDAKFRFIFDGTSSIITASTAPSASKALFRISRDGSNNVDFFEDDTSLGGGFPASNSGTFRILRLGSTSSASAIGAKFFEVVIFNELVSDSDIALIEADIKDRNSL